MRSVLYTVSFIFVGFVVTFCQSCSTDGQVVSPQAATAHAAPDNSESQQIADTKAKATRVTETKAVEKAVDPPNVVGRIGPYVITKDEFKKKLMAELRSGRDDYNIKPKPVDPNAVLSKMLAEKAMIIEGRKGNYLQSELVQASMKKFKERELVNLLLRSALQDKVNVTDEEVNKKVKDDPKLSPQQAKTILQRAKIRAAVEEFYDKLYKKVNVQKVRENFAKAAQIHQRLLLYPKEPRRTRWIRVKQIAEELTPEEKAMPLAIFDGGKVTLQDWFEALCDIAPPSRPKDLNTPEGVEKLLDSAMRRPIFVAEAKRRDLDKDENFLKQVEEREDRILLSKAIRDKYREAEKPTPEEMVVYFTMHKEEFARSPRMKIDQIWCRNFETARKVRDQLGSKGENFETVKQQYSLNPKAGPHKTGPKQEGIFFDSLWVGEPNEIIGPVKGFFRNGIKWRVVKILEKKQPQMREYSEKLVERRIMQLRRETIMAKYREKLLQKYPHTIYIDRIADIDPLNIP